jgi:hypothetical protein
MARLDFQIAKIAHNRKFNDLGEFWSTVIAEESALTGVAPRLQISRIGAVFNEADNAVLCR